MHTMIPGEIVSYDHKRQRATVQPRLSMMVDGKAMRAPQLIEVPFGHPKAGGFILHSPPKKGDEVFLISSSRSLDQSGDDASDVTDAPGRMHHLSDMVAIPGSYSKPKELKDMPEKGVYFGRDNGKAGLTIDDDGKVDFKQEGETLKRFLADFLKLFKDHTNGTLTNDQAADAQALMTRLDNLMA